MIEFGYLKFQYNTKKMKCFFKNDNMSINRWQHSFYLRGRERIRLRPKTK